MPIDPIKIPQNVQIEDRIIGTVTLRQLIITIIGCGISYAIWSSLQKAFGGTGIPVTIIAWIPAVLFIAFAFIKVYDLSLFRITLLMIERSIKPQTRTWNPRTGMSTVHLHTSVKPEKKKQSTGAEEQKPPSIAELSSMLDIPPKTTPPKTAVHAHATNQPL
ncbi:PrgI family protein [Candidatus Peregrinibacteria bacterium]|nr:PrgI family protein [Candidatus Peregrinibacteria bacterium]MBI4129650.1 PrgI family protein [Candidatus Peregrinibacteria bacterium]